ncbi:hypothetical protein ACJX0J_021273, partial [Zea mays]
KEMIGDGKFTLLWHDRWDGLRKSDILANLQDGYSLIFQMKEFLLIPVTLLLPLFLSFPSLLMTNKNNNIEDETGNNCIIAEKELDIYILAGVYTHNSQLTQLYRTINVFYSRIVDIYMKDSGNINIIFLII